MMEATEKPSSNAPQGLRWLSSQAAAAMMNVTVRRVHQLCEQWERIGLARKARADAGGRCAWEIREDADPALARVKFPETLPFDQRQLGEAHRRELAYRQEIYQGWLKARAEAARANRTERQATEDYLQRINSDGGKLNRRTLFRWHREYRARGVAGLVDSRWQPGAERSRGDDPFFESLRRRFLNLRQYSKQLCYEMACAEADEQGWQIPSYRTACRYLESLPRPVVLKYRFGEEAFVNEAEPHIERDYSVLASNELWISDHHEFDVFTNVGTAAEPVYRRPWITAWQDMRSRKIVGWAIFGHDPNTDTILRALKAGVLACGIPDGAYVDNGKDYDSFALSGMTKAERRRIHVEHDVQRIGGIFGALGVTVTHAWPYHGQSKPIERFFGTLEDRFSRRWPTYFGNKPENRPEDFQQQLERGHAPLLADFISDFQKWLENDYHAAPHSGDAMDGASPEAVWAANLASKKTAPVELLEFVLLKKSKPVRVTQRGVAWQGLHFGQYEPELTVKRLGQMVVLRVDDADLSKVTVCTLDDRIICIAPANQRLAANADSQALREAIAQKRRYRKLLKEYHEQRPRLAESLPDLMNRAAIEKNRRAAAALGPQPQPPAPNIKPLQTPLADQMPALRRALGQIPAAMAAGAESLSFQHVAAAVAQSAEADAPDAPQDMLLEIGRRLREHG